MNWHVLSSVEVEQARLKEQLVVAAITEDPLVDVPLDMVVWCCVHCRDLPSEREPMMLPELMAHISQKYVDRINSYTIF